MVALPTIHSFEGLVPKLVNIYYILELGFVPVYILYCRLVGLEASKGGKLFEKYIGR